MGSYNCGKPEVVAWIRENFGRDSTVLDVGAGDGKWKGLLPEFPNMDAVEIYEPNAKKLEGYRKVYTADIRGFEYESYDLIIFGDVIEHLSVEDAQAVLEYAKPRCRDMVVAVPFLYPQGEMYGNPNEVHIQDDLTAELFEERYPGFEVLHDTPLNYCYYHKGENGRCG